MKVGIMQPYFFPYIGYWQLINAVDKYVVYDDVNYIKRGWINRNRILVNGKVQYFNLPTIGASQNKMINEVGVNQDSRLRRKSIQTIEMAYGKAPYFQNAFPVIKEILTSEKTNIAEFLLDSLKIISDYLEIKTEFIISSELEKDCEQHGQAKILQICELLGATEYYNAVGGQKLYSFEAFAEKNIRLNFLKTDDIEYQQFGLGFEKNLSIIDVIMFNSREEVSAMLDKYTLISQNK